MEEEKKQKSSARQRADEIKEYRCKNLIAVIEDSSDIKNIGTVIRNVNALGVDKAYIIDPRRALPDDWQEMRETRSLSKTSVSAIKWSFVKRFDSTEACIEHLEKNRFVSIVTSDLPPRYRTAKLIARCKTGGWRFLTVVIDGPIHNLVNFPIEEPPCR